MLRSKLPPCVSSKKAEIWTVRSFVSMSSASLSIAWIATAQSFQLVPSRTTKSTFRMPAAYPAEGGRVDDARVEELADEQRGARHRRERREVVDGQTVQIREGGVPVVRVPLHEPDFVLLSRDVPERAGPWVVRGLSKVVVVLLQGLLADDDVPAAGEGREH